MTYIYKRAHIASDFAIIYKSHEVRFETALMLAPKITATIWKQDRYCSLDPEHKYNRAMKLIYAHFVPPFETRLSELNKYLTFKGITGQVDVVPCSSHLEFPDIELVNACDVSVVFERYFASDSHKEGFEWYRKFRNESEYGKIDVHILKNLEASEGTVASTVEYMEHEKSGSGIKIDRSQALDGILINPKELLI